MKALGPKRGQNRVVKAGTCYRGGLWSNQELKPAYTKFLSAALTTGSSAFLASPICNTHDSSKFLPTKPFILIPYKTVA